MDFTNFLKILIFRILKTLATTLPAVRGRFPAGKMRFRGHTNDPPEQNSKFSAKIDSGVSRHSLQLAEISKVIKVNENQ